MNRVVVASRDTLFGHTATVVRAVDQFFALAGPAAEAAG